MFSIIFFVLLAVIVFAAITVQLQKPVTGLIAGALIFIGGMLSCSFTVISAGHTGVQVTLGEVNPQPLTEGVHFVNPISNVKDINTQLQKAVADSQTAGTKDLQQVHTDIVINYRMSPTNLPHIYKEFGLDIDNKILGPAINDAFKAVTGKYDSSELITKRDEVNQAILFHLREKVAPFDIVVSNVSLVNFGFSADYQKAIEAKVIATQQTAKAEQDLRRIEIEAKQAIAVAEGKARAIAIETQAINSQGGDNYVKLKQIEKWNGKYPDTVVNGSASLMMNMGK